MAESGPSTQLFTNSVYDKLKYFALIVLPALGALYFGLAQIWGLPETEKVIGSIAVVDTFLGILLKQSTDKYYRTGSNFDGEVNVTPEDGGNKVQIAFNTPPEDLVDEPGRHSMEFKINKLAGR